MDKNVSRVSELWYKILGKHITLFLGLFPIINNIIYFNYPMVSLTPNIWDANRNSDKNKYCNVK